jgi:hypothetical protein
LLAVLAAGAAISAQDKYSLKVPYGLAFSEFKGYEDWKVISVSHAGLIAVILGNPAMIDAYRAGAPGNGKPFPDGAKMAKVHWNPKKAETEPGQPAVPSTLHDTEADQPPQQNDAKCGFACHTIVKNQDYVFTAYGKR